VQVDPIISTVKAPGSKRLAAECDRPLSSSASNFNLRRYTLGKAASSGSRGLFTELATLAREGGVKGLYAGWTFRAGRAGPTCGIVLMAYEMAKTM